MGYILKGRLYGSICGSCQEALANIKVRLYRPADPTKVTAAAIASPKETFALLAEALLGARQKLLIAETTTDGDGNYLFRLGEDYDGGPVEFDIYVEKVPNQQASKQTFAPVQAAITTVQPAWRQGDGDQYAIWDNTLSVKQWCGIRAKFDAWTICGRVVACDTKAPLAGMTVRAFDGDWLGDDWLGSGVTDGSGRFRIDYTGAAFRKFLGPFNVTGSGPDLYFKVFDPSMTLLPPLEGYARAHMPDRDDASNCFCVELCVNFVAPPVTPWFTSVGDFDIYADINSSGDGKINKAVLGSSGVHGGAGFAFNGDLTLVGQVPAFVSGQAMKYRFLFASPSGSSTLVPITGSYIFPVQVEETQPIIGWDFNDGHGPRTSATGPFPAPKRKVFVAAGVAEVTALTGNPANTSWTQPIIPPGSGPNLLPDLVLIPDAQGWVNVPNVLLAGLLGNKLIGFRSYAAGAVPGGGPVPVPTGWTYDVPGGWVPVAGDNVTSLTSPTGAGHAPAVARNGGRIDLYFEARPVGAVSPPYSQGPLSIYVNNWSSVVLLDIAEFHGAAANDCSPITSSLDIQYTADHELMRAWNVQIVTAATLPSPLTPPLPGGSTPRGGHGTLTYNTGGPPAWESCSYVVYLHTQRALTNGYVPDDGDSYTWLSFCKE